MFHNCFRDCVFLVSFLNARLWQATYLGNKCPCVTCSVDKSYGCFTTNPLRGGIQVSSATRQSSVSWNFNRMSKTETKENKMDTVWLYHMLYKEPRSSRRNAPPGDIEGAPRDGTNNDQARHYNRNPLLSIIVQLLYSGRPLNSLQSGLSDDLRDKHSVQRIVYCLQ